MQVERNRLTGHRSAASFPTGPVIADPFISPFGLTILIEKEKKKKERISTTALCNFTVIMS